MDPRGRPLLLYRHRGVHRLDDEGQHGGHPDGRGVDGHEPEPLVQCARFLTQEGGRVFIERVG